MKRPVGERLKSIRLDRELSQKDMAELIDMSPRYYQDVESGNKVPSFDKVATALSKLNIKYADFAEEKPVPPQTVAEMSVDQFMAHLSNTANKDTLELLRLKKKLESIPDEVFDSWREASTANKALCMFLLTGDVAYVDVLPLSAQSTLKTILRALGTKLR